MKRETVEQKAREITPLIIAVDFDGTCVKHEFPEIGEDIGAAPVLKRLVAAGHKLILYTMRSNCEGNTGASAEFPTVTDGPYLDHAIEWFRKNEIPLWAHQTNPHQSSWTRSPKCYAQLYIDDAALGAPLKYDIDPEIEDSRPYIDWQIVETELEMRDILPVTIPWLKNDDTLTSEPPESKNDKAYREELEENKTFKFGPPPPLSKPEPPVKGEWTVKFDDNYGDYSLYENGRFIFRTNDKTPYRIANQMNAVQGESEKPWNYKESLEAFQKHLDEIPDDKFNEMVSKIEKMFEGGEKPKEQSCKDLNIVCPKPDQCEHLGKCADRFLVASKPDPTEKEEPKPEKGDKGGECNRTVCHNKPAIFYNHSTRQYYCEDCAHLLNRENKKDSQRIFGHDLCTLWEDKPPEKVEPESQEELWKEADSIHSRKLRNVKFLITRKTEKI